MEKLYQQWKDSGLSRKAFSTEHNLSYQTFNYWHKRFHKTESPEPNGFAELTVPVAPAHYLEVVLPSGSRIIFQQQPSADWLRELLR
jgi:hypothetical protein